MIMELWYSGKKVYQIKKRKIVKEFIKKLKERTVWNVEGNINEVWKRMATCDKNIAKEVVGETKNIMPENKEMWWDEEIQRVVASKEEQFKLWQKSRKREDCIEHKNLCEIVKSAVRKAKRNKYIIYIY